LCNNICFEWALVVCEDFRCACCEAFEGSYIVLDG
jgi:hypothetical protein